MIFSSDEQAQPHSAMSENEFINRMRDHMAEEVGGYVCIIVNTCITFNKETMLRVWCVFDIQDFFYNYINYYYCGVQGGAHPPKVL